MAAGGLLAIIDRGRGVLFRWTRTGLEWPLVAWALAAIFATLMAADPWASADKLRKLPLWAMVFFPQCWDGVNLDSPDHKSHMSYTVNRACPATHPVALPEISFNVIYEVTEKNAPLHWRLSSDTYDRSLPAGYSSHGDWFNGWKSEFMKAFIDHCDRASRDCHAHLLGDGRMFY